MSGSTESSGTIGFSIPFGSAAPSIFEASPGVTFSGGPTFSVAILDTQQFINGILSPIDINTIGYFLQQRLALPPPILFHLLFEKIDLVSADGQVVREVENSPADEEKLREFQALITDLIAQGLTTERVTKTVDIGPPLLPDQAVNPDRGARSPPGRIGCQ
ncbi:hypothetical protein [Nitrosomonas communis]|uniref:hypothetical protein n=1 Tax=Nitrosomonas communis TaxID=44574 RepID=UPI0026E9526D|nr:hypothetical protein [Nitrosomonas communis]MCO6428217.1 hypothetical protein [Nitrosomonas communis]